LKTHNAGTRPQLGGLVEYIADTSSLQSVSLGSDPHFVKAKAETGHLHFRLTAIFQWHPPTWQLNPIRRDATLHA